MSILTNIAIYRNSFHGIVFIYICPVKFKEWIVLLIKVE